MLQSAGARRCRFRPRRDAGIDAARVRQWRTHARTHRNVTQRNVTHGRALVVINTFAERPPSVRLPVDMNIRPPIAPYVRSLMRVCVCVCARASACRVLCGWSGLVGAGRVGCPRVRRRRRRGWGCAGLTFNCCGDPWRCVALCGAVWRSVTPRRVLLADRRREVGARRGATGLSAPLARGERATILPPARSSARDLSALRRRTHVHISARARVRSAAGTLSRVRCGVAAG